MGVILDTSVLIGAERGAIHLEKLLESVAAEPIALASITAAELLHGCHRAKDAPTRMRRFAFVDAILDVIPALHFGLIEARRHAELRADLARSGSLIGSHDMLIGATALAQGYRVATLNTREFGRVPGLSLVNMKAFLR